MMMFKLITGIAQSSSITWKIATPERKKSPVEAAIVERQRLKNKHKVTANKQNGSEKKGFAYPARPSFLYTLGNPSSNPFANKGCVCTLTFMASKGHKAISANI